MKNGNLDKIEKYIMRVTDSLQEQKEFEMDMIIILMEK